MVMLRTTNGAIDCKSVLKWFGATFLSLPKLYSGILSCAY